ncbi:MAG: hypothetical protein JWM81_748 [Candidatus Saccharibacteria bacterium]|nr:hypothetical protein [Candidatus Saccharibacteria bacterium]
MDPSTNNQLGGNNLPPPIAPELQNVAMKQPPEAMTATAENQPGSSAALPLLPTYPLPIPSAPVANDAQAVASSTTQSGAPVVADDTDLIEKEWVTKAKQIVERTREDPYQQSKDMTVFKADYMQKRYNKSIKLSE